MEQVITNKPLLLFAPIYDSVATDFVDKMNEVPESEDIEIWVNSPGGRVFAGWSIIGAMQKRTGKKTVCIMGHAASMAIFFALFADEVEALEVSQFMIHRADGYVETPEDQAFLDKINKDLRKQMESRLNIDLFESVTGKTLDQIFDPKQRVDLWIDAKQAKKIGLISKIKKLTPEQIKAYNEKFVAFADFKEPTQEPSQRSEEVKTDAEINNNKKSEKKMTKAEILAQHPEVCEAIQKEAVLSERERVKSYLAFLDVDKDNVLKSVKDGDAFTNAVLAEMTVKITAKKTADEIASDSAKNTPTGKPEDKTEAEKELEAFEKEVEKGVKKINVY